MSMAFHVGIAAIMDVKSEGDGEMRPIPWIFKKIKFRLGVMNYWDVIGALLLGVAWKESTSKRLRRSLTL